MPSADFGKPINLGGKDIIRLKSKGEKVHFRFAKGGVYDGKHFIKGDDGKWVVTFCPRIMSQQPCQYCSRYFELLKEAKQEKNEAKQKKMKDSAKKAWAPSIAFYYPVLDRGDHKAKILQTTFSVRQSIEEEVKNGINVYDYDWILSRTDSDSPAQFYRLSRVDSKDTEDITNDEDAELKRGALFNMEEMLGHTTNESSMSMEPDDDVEEMEESV